MSKHVILYVPGLGDGLDNARQLALRFWRIYGVEAYVHPMCWADGERFAPKLERLLNHIDELHAAGKRVSLVGESAGASAAMNAYAQRPNGIHRVAHICGKLRGAQNVSGYTYGRNPAFAESMAQLPKSVEQLSSSQMQRVLSVHPLADMSVPVRDTILPGINVRTIPSINHMLSIALGITIFSGLLVGFIKRR